jgi:hypothetical protein
MGRQKQLPKAPPEGNAGHGTDRLDGPRGDLPLRSESARCRLARLDSPVRAPAELHAYVPDLHFEQFDCLFIARRGGTSQQLAERFVICFAVSFGDLVNLSKYRLALLFLR